MRATTEPEPDPAAGTGAAGDEGIEAEPDPSVTLPTRRSFLVQFRPGPPGSAAATSGRVEHLVSGRSARFAGWAGLRGFIERTLADPRR